MKPYGGFLNDFDTPSTRKRGDRQARRDGKKEIEEQEPMSEPQTCEGLNTDLVPENWKFDEFYRFKNHESMDVAVLTKIMLAAMAAEERGEWKKLRLGCILYSQEFIITGWRPKTKEEQAISEANDKAVKARQEELERDQLKHLKWKYEK